MHKNPATAWSDFLQRRTPPIVHFAEDEISTLMTSLAQEQSALVAGGSPDGGSVKPANSPWGTMYFYFNGVDPGIAVGIDDNLSLVCRPY
jgi:hypothetical protein